MLNSTCSAFQSNLKLPMRFICMTWPLHNILFKVLDKDSLSWKFTALAIKSKRHKWSSERFAMWFSTECCAGHQVELFIIADCFAPFFPQVADAYLLIVQKQSARNETLWKLNFETPIQLHWQYSLEISDEITIKTAMTIYVSYI